MRISALLACIVSLCVLCVENTFSGEYLITKGEEIDVCRVYAKNLNVFSRLHQPMVCERNISPDITQLSKPTWVELDLAENKKLVKKIKKFLSHGDQYIYDKNIDNELHFENLFDRQINKIDKLYVAAIDIDNDGIKDQVARYREGICQYTDPFSAALLSLSENLETVDVHKTRLLLRNTDEHDVVSNAIEHLYQIYDVFFYTNITYFDRWNARNETLSVYYVSGGAVKELCNYKYKINKGGIDK